MALPTGPAVAFLFTDIEGSTRSERSVGSATWATLMGRHDTLVRDAIEHHDGVVVKTEGDAFFAAFAAERAIRDEPWPDDLTIRVRMGIHLGEGRQADIIAEVLATPVPAA